ncbi:MAG: hydroxymethylglutaryl-CoA reductase, degradative [Flavobacterium psychrophilum]
MTNAIAGFSKLSKADKLNWLSEQYFATPHEASQLLQQYWNSDQALQKLHDEFIENTVSNFYLPLGVAPNFVINGKNYTIPMAIEESSVVAAAAKSAKFWASRGGFKTQVINSEKIGQVHFMYQGDSEKLANFIESIQPNLREATRDITKNMEARGGGITQIELRNQTHKLPNYFQLHATFETKDSMGANFINSCLEQFAKTMTAEAQEYAAFTEAEKDIQIVMSILSNYVPNCLVRAEVSCPIEELAEKKLEHPAEFAEKFVQAVQIAQVEPFRAVTHNKGIMNGIDAVVLATGNDFRAVEAGVHAYAARDGQYRSLTHATIEDGIFRFWIEIPLALGTVGGLTNLHPLVKWSLELLQKPSAHELMQLVAVAGLTQNFAALRSLTTTGIQEGHMKMHLNNILLQLQATQQEREAVQQHFKKETVTHAAVVSFVAQLRA